MRLLMSNPHTSEDSPACPKASKVGQKSLSPSFFVYGWLTSSRGALCALAVLYIAHLSDSGIAHSPAHARHPCGRAQAGACRLCLHRFSVSALPYCVRYGGLRQGKSRQGHPERFGPFCLGRPQRLWAGMPGAEWAAPFAGAPKTNALRQSS